MVGGPYQPVDPIAPARPSPSLLTSARDRSGDQFGANPAPVPPNPAPEGALAPMRERWRSGITWNTVDCNPAHNWERCPSAVTTKADPTGLNPPVQTESFWIYTTLEVDWHNMTEEAPLDQYVLDLNEAHTPFAVARALWMGEGLPDDALQPTLRRNAADITVGDPMDLDDGIAVLLARYEAQTGGSGGAILHVPSQLAVSGLIGGAQGGARVAWPEGNLYRSVLGAVLCPGPGYPQGPSPQAAPTGFGPKVADGPPSTYKGTDSDEYWVYVTGPVEYALAQQRIVPAEERQQRAPMLMNKYQVWAERAGVVRFDPCAAFAVRCAGTIAGIT